MNPLDRLTDIGRKPERLVMGLLSGTSLDAVEAALCRISGSGANVRLALVAHASSPLPAALKERVLTAASAAELCALNVVLGEAFADAAQSLVKKAGVAVDLVGSHGQTLAHLPPPHPTPSTLQLGEASVVAERLGVPVVCDFRARDMAVGGQGAPLVPYMDWAVFRKAGAVRAFQNFGGIGNVSVVRDRLEDTLAFDTGPGNMLLDALAQRTTNGALAYDRDGELSSKGAVDAALLAFMLQHPFLERPPPKSTGREEFGKALLDDVWKRAEKRPYDALATAVAFTVEATAHAYEKFVFPVVRPEAMYLSGGGSRHPGIVAGLKKRLAPLPIEPLDVLGFPEPAKEAACFALLANEWLMGVPQNAPSATGAKKAVILGKLVL